MATIRSPSESFAATLTRDWPSSPGSTPSRSGATSRSTLAEFDLIRFPTKTKLAGREFRQIYILDLGHEEPTILLTNDRDRKKATVAQLVTRYAQRMLIENALSDAVRFFHIDALSSSVGMKVDFDMALLVIASGLYRLLARQMRGYEDSQARQMFRDLVDMPADVVIGDQEVHVRFQRRAHLPILLASGLFDKPIRVPWWEGRTLVLIT